MKKQLLILLQTLCLSAQMAFGQTTTTSNVRPATTAYLGWDGTGANSGSLDIKNLFGSQPINFYNGTGPTLCLAVTAAGDLNLVGGSNRYQINGANILYHNNITSNIFCGYTAGNTSGTGTKNAAFGYAAGQSFTSGTDNTAIGANALEKNTSGKYNVAIGSQALTKSSISSGSTAVGFNAAANWDDLSSNIVSAFGYNAAFKSVSCFQLSAFGESALYFNTAAENSAFGADAMVSNTTGTYNAAFGDDALFDNNGSNNTGIGSEAAVNISSGWYNTFTGRLAGNNLTTGSSNTGYGSNAMGFNSQTCTGSFNTAVGDSAMYLNSTGVNNTSLGYTSLMSNSTGANNVAIGYQSLFTNTGSNNNALGYEALYNNTSGTPNDAFGHMALFTNTTGEYNAAFGYNSLYTNSTGYYNSAFGNGALSGNTTGNASSAFGFYALVVNTGSENSAFGVDALVTNTSSPGNCAFGAYSLYKNLSGSGYNCAFGRQAMYFTTGDHNTALGTNAGITNTTGSNITCVGSGADVNAVNLSNATAIGSGAIATGSNIMWAGNNAITSFNITGTAVYLSDGRFKTNVKEEVKGLEFIKKLRPVTYQMDTKSFDDFIIQNMPDSVKTKHQAGMDFTPSMAIIHSGFIAQEVETAANSCNFKSSIVHAPANNTDPYGLAYQEIVVPLVKAVQELSAITDSLKTVTTKQDSLNKVFKKQSDSLKAVSARQDSINQTLQNQINNIVNSCCQSSGRHLQNNNNENTIGTGNSTGVISIELNDVNTVVLNQNAPNPFAEQTLITYNVPVINSSAQILFYNTNGVMIKSVDIKMTGQGQLTVYANDLSNGIYSYTLVVDGKIVDTKRMIKQK